VPTQVLAIESVVSDPDIRGGKPIVAGTTLRVSDLAAYHVFAGLTPDQLSVQFDLDLSRVHAALAYYFQHKAEIECGPGRPLAAAPCSPRARFVAR
jgi:uncharacterized protein (DUF433 family)